jgi:hypothetical protein
VLFELGVVEVVPTLFGKGVADAERLEYGVRCVVAGGDLAFVVNMPGHFVAAFFSSNWIKLKV